MVSIRSSRICIFVLPYAQILHATPHKSISSLFEGNETRRVGGTDTGTTVLDGLAVWLLEPFHFEIIFAEQQKLGKWDILRDREFTQVVANHLGLDLNLVELLSGVDTNDRADHLGDDNHVTEVSLDEVGLLVGLGLLLGLAELLDEAHGLALQTAVEPAAGTGVNDITELFGREVEELVEVDAAVGKLAELSSLLNLCRRGEYLSVVFCFEWCGVV
jgi:hypothetical protein